MKIPEPRKLPSGNWFIQLRLDGKSLSITEPDKDVCIAKAMAYKTGVLKLRKQPVHKTLREACNEYIAARESTRSVTTLNTYRMYVKNDFQDLMDKHMDKLKKADFVNAVAVESAKITRRNQKVSAAHVNKAYSFIASVLRENNVDVPENINLPTVQDIPVIMPEPEAVIQCVIGSDIELPCLLAAWFSLTESEIRALKKSESIHNGKLYITQTMVRVNNKDIVKQGSKEEKRSRVHAIPPYIQSLIDQVDGDDLCPFTPRQLYDKFQALQTKAGVNPVISFHKLRHLNASVMALLGIQKEIARERGGWQNDAVMNKVYTHTFTAARRAADDTINTYFETQLANKNANVSEK